jgi:DNA-binding beta-propeller fold protein YncE
MKQLQTLRFLCTLMLVALMTACAQSPQSTQRVEGVQGGPRYAVDPFWPKPLPNNWQIGQVAGVAVDRNNDIWIIHRPATLTEDERGATLNPKRSDCCVPAPPVLKFDQAGNLLKSWGGAGQGYNWPKNEHGIYVDPAGDVWLAGNDVTDHMILKFTDEGKFLLQIGSPGKSLGSNATNQLGRPAHMEVDATANELFVADGYLNKRVIVFDATTGAYKRHWGAYGSRPDDKAMPGFNPSSPQFANPVHCVRQMKDGLLFVCDRGNNRIQVFKKDGTFVREMVLAPDTKGSGSVWDLIAADNDQQKFILVADGTNNHVYITSSATGEILGSFGRNGRYAGDFHWVHNIAVDQQGNVYTAEVDTGKRVQRFKRVQ